MKRLTFVIVLLVTLLLSISASSLAARRVTLTVWQPWGGDLNERVQKVANDFMKFNPNIEVKVIFTPNLRDKLLTAIAARTVPDLTYVHGSLWACELASRGVLLPLDDYLKEDGLSGGDFHPMAWQQATWEGHVYSLPGGFDPDYGFFWNKDLFAECGLDPERPPRTIPELDEITAKITKYDSAGNIIRLGMVPNAGGLHYISFVFGAKLYDEAKKRFTLDHPKAVEALEWIAQNAKKYNITKIGAFNQSYGGQQQNPFYTGALAMYPGGWWELDYLKRFAPNVRYGCTTFPIPVGGKLEDAYYVESWGYAIPKGSKHPKEAFKFLKYLCADLDVTVDISKVLLNFPALKKGIERFAVEGSDNPYHQVFVKIARSARNCLPPTPVTTLMYDEMGRACDFAMYGQKTPQQALRDANKAVQEQLDKVLSRKK